MNPFEMTEEFHHTFDPTIPSEPTAFNKQKALHRAAFKIEEIAEFVYSISDNDPEAFETAVDSLHQALETAKGKIVQQKRQVTDPLVEQVDALSDLLYFTYGSFSLLGVNPEPIMEIIHQANMGKLFQTENLTMIPSHTKYLNQLIGSVTMPPRRKSSKKSNDKEQKVRSNRGTYEYG